MAFGAVGWQTTVTSAPGARWASSHWLSQNAHTSRAPPVGIVAFTNTSNRVGGGHPGQEPLERGFTNTTVPRATIPVVKSRRSRITWETIGQMRGPTNAN